MIHIHNAFAATPIYFLYILVGIVFDNTLACILRYFLKTDLWASPSHNNVEKYTMQCRYKCLCFWWWVAVHIGGGGGVACFRIFFQVVWWWFVSCYFIVPTMWVPLRPTIREMRTAALYLLLILCMFYQQFPFLLVNLQVNIPRNYNIIATLLDLFAIDKLFSGRGKPPWV